MSKEIDPSNVAATFQGRPRTCGMRFSFTDGCVLALAILATSLAFKTTDGYSLLILFVVLHFFLFCNVFRIRRGPELIWSSIFIVNCAVWIAWGNANLIGVVLCQLPVTVAQIAYEMTLPCYHGIFSRRTNRHIDDYLAGRLDSDPPN